MTQLPMPRAKPGSPVATLTAPITASDTTIPFNTSNLTSDVPNIITISTDENTFETIKYITKNAGNVVCESAAAGRGFDGTTAQSWDTGAEVARYVSAYDISSHASNIEDHESRITTLEGSTGMSFDDAEGDPAALGSVAADGTSDHPARRDHVHIKPSPADIGAATSGHNHTGVYAPDAKGVTNGDSHNHLGGDGGEIAYSSLGSIPSTFAPSAHKSSHATGQGDALAPADIGASASNHTHTFNSLTDCDSLPNNTTTYFRGDGTFATPSGEGGGTSSSIYVIAPSDASADEQAMAHITLAGTTVTTTGDVARINAAITAGYREIHFLSGSVKIGPDTAGQAGPIIGKTGVSLIGHGTTFDGATLEADDYIMKIEGQLDQVTLLNADALQGASTITLTSTTGFDAGDLAFIRSNAQWGGINDRTQLQGELCFIESLSSPTVTLQSGTYLRDTYRDANGSELCEVTPQSDIILRGITFIGPPSIQTTGLSISYGLRILIEKCLFRTLITRAVGITNCYDVRVRDCIFELINRDGYGYGVSLNYACESCSITGCTFTGCRHATAIGGGTGQGIPRNNIISNNFSLNAINSAYDCHNAGEDISYIDNVVQGGGAGIGFHGVSGIISGNIIVGTTGNGINIGYGITDINYNPSKGIILSNNQIRYTKDDALYIEAPNVTITNNIVYKSAKYGMLLTDYSYMVVNNKVIDSGHGNPNTYSDIYLTDSSHDSIVQGNVVHGTYYLTYDNGNDASGLPKPYETISATGGKSAILVSYTTDSGSWAAGTAAGTMTIEPISGSFAIDDVVTGATSAATFTPASVPVMQTKYGIRIGTGCANNAVINNDVRNSGATASILDGGTGSIIRGNVGFTSSLDLGEANTTSNGGTGGIGLPLTKNGVDLPFKSIAAGSTRITVTDNPTNKSVDIDVAEGIINHGNLDGLADDDHSQYLDTTRHASTSHTFDSLTDCDSLPNNTTTYFRGDGTFATPEGGAGGVDQWITPANVPATTDGFQFSVTDNATNQGIYRPGRPIRYTISGTTYYAIISAYATGTVTFLGSAISGTITAFEYGDMSRVIQMPVFIPGYYADGANTDLLANDFGQYINWYQGKAYCISYAVKCRVAETGATKPVVKFKVAGNSISVSGVSLSTTAWGYPANDILTNNYDVNWGEALEVSTTAGTNGDSQDLSIIAFFILV